MDDDDERESAGGGSADGEGSAEGWDADSGEVRSPPGVVNVRDESDPTRVQGVEGGRVGGVSYCDLYAVRGSHATRAVAPACTYPGRPERSA